MTNLIDSIPLKKSYQKSIAPQLRVMIDLRGFMGKEGMNVIKMITCLHGIHKSLVKYYILNEEESRKMKDMNKCNSNSCKLYIVRAHS